MTNPERFYFTSSGAPAVTPAFGSIWDVTGTAVRAVTYQHRAGTSMDNVGVTETDSGVVDGLIAQLVCDDPLAAGEVPLANFTIASRMYESDLGADAYLQAMIRVVSSDGLTERGVLYSGQSFTTVSSNPADPNYELEQLSQEVRVLTGTLSSVTAQEGDLVVIELGVRFCNATASGKNAVITLGDQSTFPGGTDVAAIVDDPGSGVVSWIEFDREVMPRRRFYLPSSGAPATSPAFGSQWEDTDDAVRLPLLDLGGTTALTQFNTDNAAGVTDVLAFQFISEAALPGGPVDPGTFALITKAVDDQGSDAYMQAVIRVVSGDGLTERGVLYSGQTFTVTSPTSTDPNYGYTNSTGLTNPRSRRVLGSCTPVIAEPGDRLVLELGSRDCELIAGSHVQGLTTGSTSIVDWGIDSINNTNIDRPWIEFTRSPFITGPPEVPEDLAAAPDCAAVIVSWTAPSIGFPPEGYEVRVDGGPEVDAGDVLSYAFTGLAGNTEYLFEVRAYGPGGFSAWAPITESTLNCDDHVVFTTEQPFCGELVATAERGVAGELDWPYVSEVTNDLTRADFFYVRAETAPTSNDHVLHEMWLGPAGGVRDADSDARVTLTYSAATDDWIVEFGGAPHAFDAPTGVWLRVDLALVGGPSLSYSVTNATTGFVYYSVTGAALNPASPAFYYHAFYLYNDVAGDGFQNWLDAINVECEPPTPGPDCDDCEPRWLVESCNIFSGQVQNVLIPLGFDFQTSKNAVGQGTITFPTRGVRAQDIWPNLSLIAIARITDDPDNPDGLFLGIVDTFEASSSDSGGTTTVGLLEITHYLWRRLIREDLTVTDLSQTVIARTLADLTAGQIPLHTAASFSDITRTFTWLASERPNIGEQIASLTGMLGGPDWEVTYARTNGAWSATIRFLDEVGVKRDLVLSSDREGAAYSLTVDGSNQATLVDGFGPTPESTGEGDEPVLIVTESDDSGVYPLFEAATSYTDLPLAAGISPEDLTRVFVKGELEIRKEPAAIPSMTIAGNDPSPSTLRLGDEVTVHIDHGAITFRGQARVVDISWSSADGSPDLRTLGFEPISRPSESVLNQTPTDDCEDC